MKTTVNFPARSVVKLYELALKSYKRIADEYGEEAAKDEADAIKAIEDNFGVIIDRYKHYENKISEIINNANQKIDLSKFETAFDTVHSYLVLAQIAFETDLNEIDGKDKSE